jgi:hypothetical protein
MKSSTFRTITLCSPLKVNRYFGGTCSLHLQGQRISQARNQREIRWQDGGDVSPTRRLTFNGLHCVMSQKIELFKFRNLFVLPTYKTSHAQLQCCNSFANKRKVKCKFRRCITALYSEKKSTLTKAVYSSTTCDLLPHKYSNLRS